MQTFKSYLKEEQEFLTEVDTSKATNAEMAICVAYNMIHNTDKNYSTLIRDINVEPILGNIIMSDTIKEIELSKMCLEL